MRVFFIGFGQAGGKLVDMFLAQDRKLGSTSFKVRIYEFPRYCYQYCPNRSDGN